MIYTFDRYTLDSDRLELRRGAEEVKIEPQVFRLLVHLIENRERVVGKEELIESVWRGRLVSDATLNTRINAARRAVGDDGRTQSLIRTFPRRGFRFVADVGEASGAGRRASASPPSNEASTEPRRRTGRKPTIVVVPLRYVGDEDEGFGAGLTSMMVTELSRRTGVNVISREAASHLSTNPVDFTRIKDDLGADYALTGTIHRIGTRLRVSVELCETDYGRQLWAERYDRELGDAFALQDELTHLILVSARWNMAAHDGERTAWSAEPVSTADRLSRAAQFFYTPTPESYKRAADLLDLVLEQEPNHGMALSMRVFALYVSSTFRPAPLSPEECKRGIAMSNLALEQEERSDFAHWVRGTLALNLERDYDSALAHAERAQEINPHYAPSFRLKGEVQCFSGDAESGMLLLESLLGEDPRAPGNAIVLWDLALACFAIDETSKALDAIDEALVRIQTMPDFYLTRAAILVESGRIEDARTIVGQLNERYEGLSLSCIRRPPFKEDRHINKYIGALRSAGLSE